MSAVRTPIGKFGGSLASQSASDMGVVAARRRWSVLEFSRSRWKKHFRQRTPGGRRTESGTADFDSRGVPQDVPAYTVNKACASGIKSIALGFQEIAIAIWIAFSRAAPIHVAGSVLS